eukprot:c2159_g1_i1.p1 GENE.c2159_g1_i1~~c2159_g1_i1.p1  ORF type:complete len:186 (-),score=30.97 c2159_g1_i1:12-569(-)
MEEGVAYFTQGKTYRTSEVVLPTVAPADLPLNLSLQVDCVLPNIAEIPQSVDATLRGAHVAVPSFQIRLLLSSQRHVVIIRAVWEGGNVVVLRFKVISPRTTPKAVGSETLETPISQVRHFGGVYAERMEQLNIRVFRDLGTTPLSAETIVQHVVKKRGRLRVEQVQELQQAARGLLEQDDDELA